MKEYMKMRTIKFKQFERQISRTLREHAPVILTGIGVAGVGVTSYMTAKASFKAAERLREEKITRAELSETITQPVTLTLREQVAKTWMLYMPAVGVGTLTCVAIVCGQRMSLKRLSAATTALAITERAYSEHKDKVREIVGDKKNQVINDTIAQDKINNLDPGAFTFGSGEVLFVDSYSSRPFMSSHEEVTAAINHINNMINREGEASLTEVYGWLGLPATKISDKMGWRGMELIELALSTGRTDDNRPAFVLDFKPAPTFDYLTR